MQIPKPPLPYRLYLPAEPDSGLLTPFIFASPHSGCYYPPEFIARTHLSVPALSQSADAFVDMLFDRVPTFGATLLTATYGRAYLDLNRSSNELDADMFTPKLNSDTLINSLKVQAGLGLIPRLVAEDIPIYKHLLPAREATKRCDTIHQPYHEKLASLIAARREQFGTAFLIDCHSMPSEAPIRPGMRHRHRSKTADIVLGDCWGSACDRELTSMAEEYFISEGFRVRRNLPYSGGFSTLHYGKPECGVNALQIEINRGIYMDEISQTTLPEFSEIQNALINVSKRIVDTAGQHLVVGSIQNPRAAE